MVVSGRFAMSELPLLRRVADGAAVVACTTCRISADVKDDAEGTRGGALLVAALRAVQQSDPRYAEVAVQEMACLFACSDHCTVHVRAPGKVGYVLGRFAPDVEAARAILDYAIAHAASAEGRVPFRAWPQGVKGHFIVRVPPAGFVAE
jgi:predicted metal-binding protein